jgi:hypothetical protein
MEVEDTFTFLKPRPSTVDNRGALEFRALEGRQFKVRGSEALARLWEPLLLVLQLCPGD